MRSTSVFLLLCALSFASGCEDDPTDGDRPDGGMAGSSGSAGSAGSAGSPAAGATGSGGGAGTTDADGG